MPFAWTQLDAEREPGQHSSQVDTKEVWILFLEGCFQNGFSVRRAFRYEQLVHFVEVNTSVHAASATANPATAYNQDCHLRGSSCVFS